VTIKRSNTHPGVAAPADPPRARLARAREGGFILIEVIVSALLVAVIVVGTLTGLDVVNRATADQRRHEQAIVLAAQSQEQMRSDTATTLSELYEAPHTYERKLGSTVYTITQGAEPLNSGGSTATCSATETSSQTGARVLITTTVSWAQQRASKRPAVKTSSVITPPTGSGLEVDVQNGGSPPAGVAGVSVVVKYVPAGSGVQNTLEATTGSAGCVLFTAIPATKATVEIREKLNFVTTSGTLVVPPKELSIAPNITTHYQVTYNEGGRITVEFTYKGAKTYERQPGNPKTLEKVTGDTFVAYNSSVGAEPKFTVGSSSFGPVANVGEYEKGGEEHYKPLTGPERYAAAASSPAGAKYSLGDLFPFGVNSWQVYPGDCHANSIATMTEKAEKLANPATLVSAGKTAVVTVPTSYVLLNVYSGTSKANGSLESTSYPVKVTNTGCEAEPLPNNASATNLIHKQTSSKEGHLESPFQPFGKYKLCLYHEAKKRTYTAAYENTTVAGSTINLYLSEVTKEERETEEAKTRTAREAAEAAARAKRETEEAAARAKWKEEREKGKIKGSQEKEKINNQTKEREAAERKEAEKRVEAEKAEEATRKAAETEEGKRAFVIQTGQKEC
jgi:Tfp pilus assembly protein PilV